MPFVGLVFELECAKTLPGESICVLGARPEMGGWRLDEARTARLCTNTFMYPRWTAGRTLWLEYSGEHGGRSLTVEYKYVVAPAASSSAVRWEDIGGNRRVVVPLEPSSMWLVTDAQFGRMSTAEVSRTTMLDVKSRWAKFMPDWLSMSMPQIVKATPDRFMLTPRAPLSTVGNETRCTGAGAAHVYDIEQEFSALSPDRARRTLVFPALATAASCSPSWFPSDFSADSESSDDEADYDEDISEEVVLSRKGYDALLDEVSDLREENQELRHTVQTLMQGGQVPENAAEPRRRRCSGYVDAMLAQHRERVKGHTTYFRSRHSESTSGATTPTAVRTPSPRRRKQHNDDMDYWAGPLASSLDVSLQEPQEEPFA